MVFVVDLIGVGYSDDMLELVLYALGDLRKLLKEQGSNLMIRFGSTENVIRELALEVFLFLIPFNTCNYLLN